MLVLSSILLCVSSHLFVFFFKQKTAYEMRISDWSSDVCSSDLEIRRVQIHSWHVAEPGPELPAFAANADRALEPCCGFTAVQALDGCEFFSYCRLYDRKSVV